MPFCLPRCKPIPGARFSTRLVFRYSVLLLMLAVQAARADGGGQKDSLGSSLYQAVCAACHGAKGEGKEELKTPSIAHLPAWYVTTQLRNFQEGKRGSDAAHDPQGAMMATIAKALQPPQVEAVARHVESLALVVPASLEMKTAQVEDGQRLFYERCMECHRYNASGEMLFGSPPLVGRQGWYLLAQLKKFKALHRGAVKGDEKGAKMVQMTTQFIDNEQTMKNVIGYILTLNPKPGQAE